MKKPNNRNPTRLHRGLGIVLWLLMLSLPERAMPAIAFINSPGELSPTSTLLTFEGLAAFAEPMEIGGIQFSLDNGRGPDVASDPSRPREFGPSEGTIVQNVVSPGFLNLTLGFPGPVMAAAFEMRTLPSDNIDITLFSSGLVSGSFTLQTRNTSTDIFAPLYFYGFKTTFTFDRMLIDVQAHDRGFFEMDNLRFTPVPEPASITLAALGVVALFLLRSIWRQRSD